MSLRMPSAEECRTRAEKKAYEKEKSRFEKYVAEQTDEAEKQQKKKAAAAAALILQGKKNKKKCIQHESEFMKKGNCESNVMFTPRSEKTSYRPLTVGSYVAVTEDLSTGSCSHGGYGFVTGIQQDNYYDIEYSGHGLASQAKEVVHISRLTEHSLDTSPRQRSAKAKAKGKAAEKRPKAKRKRQLPIYISLTEKLKKGRRQKKGWKRDENKKTGHLCASDKTKLIADFDLLEATQMRKNEIYGLLEHAYDISLSTLKRLASGKQVQKDKEEDVLPTTMITKYELAERNITAKKLFIKNYYVKESTHAAPNRLEREKILQDGEMEWALMGKDSREQWEMRRRSELARFPHIEKILLAKLRGDPVRPFSALASDINHWCDASTIKRWFKAIDDSFFYTQQIIPSLSREQNMFALQKKC